MEKVTNDHEGLEKDTPVIVSPQTAIKSPNITIFRWVFKVGSVPAKGAK